MLGLTLVAEMPARFDRVVIGNTALPAAGELYEAPGFRDFVNLSQTLDPFVPSFFPDTGTPFRNLTDAEKAAYDAPFPSELHLASVTQFPLIVPRGPDSPGSARIRKERNVLKSWTKPVLLQWGLQDLTLGQFIDDFRALIPGTKLQPHALYPDAGHFLQEDVGTSIAIAIVQWLKDSQPSTCMP